MDSASTSLTPEPVLRSVLDYYRSYRANVGRGVYHPAQLADQRYRDAHRKVSSFVGGDEGTLVFTRNATESINIVACGLPWKKKAEGVEPLMAGGGMVEDVCDDDYNIKKGYEGFEAGTPDISGGIGLGAAVDYLTQMGMPAIEGVEVYGPLAPKDRGGVVSFNVLGLMPHEVALMLDQASNIMVRSGLHCCIPLMRHLGLKYGTMRASLYLYNTREEIDKLLGALEQIAKMA